MEKGTEAVDVRLRRSAEALDTIIRPAPGRRSLEGMRTNRKVTGMKVYHSPRRLKTMVTRGAVEEFGA